MEPWQTLELIELLRSAAILLRKRDMAEKAGKDVASKLEMVADDMQLVLDSDAAMGDLEDAE